MNPHLPVRKRRDPDPLPVTCSFCLTAWIGDVIPPRVIDGVGLRRLHPTCEQKMDAMGYSIHDERRAR